MGCISLKEHFVRKFVCILPKNDNLLRRICMNYFPFSSFFTYPAQRHLIFPPPQPLVLQQRSSADGAEEYHARQDAPYLSTGGASRSGSGWGLGWLGRQVVGSDSYRVTSFGTVYNTWFMVFLGIFCWTPILGH